MKARLFILLLPAALLACNGQPTTGGPTYPGTTVATTAAATPTAPEPTPEAKPDPDAVKKEIENMDMRLRATQDVQPLPPELRTTDTPPRRATSNDAALTPTRVATTSADIRDVIAALETKSDRTPSEQFQLDALKAVTAADDRKSLVAKLYGDVKRDYTATWHVVLAALDTCAAGKPDETLARLREAEGMLRPKTALLVGTPVFCTDRPGGGAAIEGIGLYNPRKSTAFARGERALLYLEVADFEVRKKGANYEYRLSREASLLDLAGREAHKFKKEGDVFTVRGQIERTFWPMMFRVPKDVYAGEYVLRVTVTDEFKKQFAEERIRMTVK